jgi:hypothetical protein
MALHHDITINSVAEYVALFSPGGQMHESKLSWHRGDSTIRAAGNLLPSIARAPVALDREWELYQRFRQNAAVYVPYGTMTEWDWMLYMRHYGVRTRLLDWTESPMVALFFAVEEPKDHGVDGAVWSLDPIRLNKLAGFDERLYCAAMDSELEVYTPSEVRASPPGSLNKPAALIVARSFARLVAQQGVFTIIHRTPTSLEMIADDELVGRISVPAAAKPDIATALNALGIQRHTLFPELQSLPGAR